MSSLPSGFAPIVASTARPVRLAMQRLWLTGQLLPAGDRLVVQHVFQSDERGPLEVIYSFPVPRDAALRRFRITGEGFEAHSELRRTEEAVKAYEQGIADGSLSALARQYGDGIVNLTVGNIRPKETVAVYLEILAGNELRDDGFRFRFPFTLAPAYHSKMRVVDAGEAGELELPAEEFGDLILPPFHKRPSSLHQIGFDLSLPCSSALREIASPSHAVAIERVSAEETRVRLAVEKDVPDRDLALDVRFCERRVEALAGPDSAGKRSFAIVVPSTCFGAAADAPRRVAILLDRSGSMDGEPIAQARKAIEACLAALGERDSFTVLAFDDKVEAMTPAAVPATREERNHARGFLDKVNARGGTELTAGVRAAARALEGGGDILVITDGQVFGTEAILADARATGIRLFCLGIGSASQDRFLALLARETGGVSRFVTPRERVDLAAVELFASMGRPIAERLKAEGVQPEPPQAVFAGAPVLLFGETDSAEPVNLRWDAGSMSIELPPGGAVMGETVRLLRGSRLITDWESRYPSEEAVAPLVKRKQSRVAARLLEWSTAYELASREMALVAVVKRAGDRPGELPETRVVPVGMPQNTAFEPYFLDLADASQAACALSAPAPPVARSPRPARRVQPGMLAERRSLLSPSAPARLIASDADLVDLAAMLEPDGGMPGGNPGNRAARSIAGVFAFVAQGHTLTAGAFRLHVGRLAEYLKSLEVASDDKERLRDKALEAARTGKAPAGDWLILARDARTGWKQVESALR